MRSVVATLALVAGFLGFFTVGAHAQDKLTREFEAGVDAYRLGKLEDARAHLEKAIAMNPALPGPHRFLAAVSQAQGRFEDCIASARTAIEMNPRSSEIADTRKLHDACRSSAGRAVFRDDLGDGAAIAVTTSVPGATVTISGLSYGGTPLAPRRIKPGTHEVSVEKSGFRPAKASVNALPGVVTDVDFELVADASVVVKIAPSDSTSTLTIRGGDSLVLDGDSVSFEPNEPISIAPGEHLVEVRRANKEPWRRRVRLEPRQERTLVPSFETAHAHVRTRGWLAIGAGVGFGLVGGVAAAMSVDAEGSSRTALYAVSGVSFGVTAVAVGLGIYWVVRGRPVDRDAPPPFALAPIEGGALASTGFSW
ncbi:MAG: PEGA domain-containing protein [Kofleriaceae bacterium]